MLWLCGERDAKSTTTKLAKTESLLQFHVEEDVGGIVLRSIKGATG